MKIPTARTYHASCLLGKYMIVIGGESLSDLKDLWALDLEQRKWIEPTIENFDSFTPKRFHTANVIGNSKIITFGGCHSEYVHLNELHIFDLAEFLRSPSNSTISCVRIENSLGVPSSRWGHSSAVYQDRLYILGGRNDEDLIDLQVYDMFTNQWEEIKPTALAPKPRRRHSSIIYSGSLIVFGGFDGAFFNDMYLLDLNKELKQTIKIQPSTIDQDYMSLVNDLNSSDITFTLDDCKRS